jgi:stress-induced morphogen
MSEHPTDFQGDILEAIRTAVEGAIPGARCVAAGAGGHFTLEVVSPAFQGLNMLASHRLVLTAIAHLMKGDRAPVHAVDSLKTRAA